MIYSSEMFAKKASSLPCEFTNYIFNDDDYTYTKCANGDVVIFNADGQIEALTIKEYAIDEIKSQPYFR